MLEYDEAPRPTPGNGEVLVEIYAAGMNRERIERRAEAN
jgi:NADPH:quinone reductase-like Zn-dependent oxidoreductase